MIGPRPNSSSTRVLRAIGERSSYLDLSAATGLTVDTVSCVVSKLRSRGYVQRTNPDVPLPAPALFTLTRAGEAFLNGESITVDDDTPVDTRNMVQRAIEERPMLARCWGVAA